ncbi:MAG: hypothetical protein AVDCRST_MAG30-4252, partial [uncultured Solirubrobacteraceae bacterium]
PMRFTTGSPRWRRPARPRAAGVSAAAWRTRPARTDRAATSGSEPGEDELIGDYEDGGAPADGEPTARAAFIGGLIKKGACKVPGLKQICKWTFGKLETEAVRACTKSVAACRSLVDKVCKVSRKACNVAQDLACVGLDLFCRSKVKPGPRPGLVRPFAGQRNRILDNLDQRSTRFGKAKAKGGILRESRDVRVSDPQASARATFRRLARGPGVTHVSRTTTQWTVRTPEGRVVRLRRPEASSTNTWTVDVQGGARHVKYKFLR